MNIHKTLTIFLMALTGFQIAAMQQPDLRQSLVDAAKVGNNERVEQLMLAGALVTPQALYYPTKKGNYGIVRTIFECGVDPESPAGSNQWFGSTTVFTKLVLNQNLPPQRKEKLIRLYLKHGADIELQGRWAHRMLIYEVHNLDFNTLKLLLEHGADANAQDESGNTALMELAYQSVDLSQVKKAKLLIKHGADVNLKVTISGETCLMRAVNEGNKPLVELLLNNGADVNVIDESGATCLMMAVHQGDKPLVELLLKNGADVNLKDDMGQTGLLWAVYKGNKPLVKLLLNNGADVNLKLRKGEVTCLLIAVHHENKPIVELLLNNGADVNLTDEKKLTCLMRAVYKGNKPLVELLLNKGAAVYLRDYCGRSALDYAKDNSEILKLLEGTQVTPAEKFIRKALEYVSLGILSS